VGIKVLYYDKVNCIEQAQTWSTGGLFKHNNKPPRLIESKKKFRYDLNNCRLPCKTKFETKDLNINKTLDFFLRKYFVTR